MYDLVELCSKMLSYLDVVKSYLSDKWQTCCQQELELTDRRVATEISVLMFEALNVDQ